MSLTHEHDQAALTSLRLLGPATPNWVPATPGVDYDVLVIGGGQCGIATAFALRQAGITSTILIDAGSANQPGIWSTKARMRNLRTPKEIPGPELHNPALGFRAWFEASYGQQQFDAIEKIPKELWHSYLLWFRRITGVEVQAQTTVTHIIPQEKHFLVHLQHQQTLSTITVRRIVLATGYPGAGGLNIPSRIQQTLPRKHYHHTDEDIDFSELSGQSVGVIGAASSAFDNAATALEHGAKEVHMFCRHVDLNRNPSGRGVMYAGAEENFYALPDAVRWEIAATIKRRALHPVPAVIERATRHPNFYLHLNTTTQDIVYNNNVIHVNTPSGPVIIDHLLLGTGYKIDPVLRPELSAFSQYIQLWEDRPDLPACIGSETLGRYPYLGPHYEFLPKTEYALTNSYVSRIYAVNLSALVSFSRHVGEIASLRSAVPRVIRGISQSLFHEDALHHQQQMLSTFPDEFTDAIYQHAVAEQCSV